jgi:hypothetical protein
MAYDQALRVVPGMLIARFRGSKDDALALLDGYFEEMSELTDLDTNEEWAALFSACMTWFANSVRALGRSAGDDPLEILNVMTMAAATWEADGD